MVALAGWYYAAAPEAYAAALEVYYDGASEVYDAAALDVYAAYELGGVGVFDSFAVVFHCYQTNG